MADQAEIERIRAYLKQHGSTYDRDALRDNLIADGHDPEAVAEAMRQVAAEESQAPPAPRRGSTRAATALAIVGTVLLNGGACLVGTRISVPFLFTSGLGVVLSLLVMVFYWKRHPAIARGVGWGCGIWALIVVGLVVVIILSLNQGP